MYNLPITFHGLVLRSNHERLRLKRVESKRICVEELLAIIRQDIRDEIRANVCDEVRVDLGSALSDDSDSYEGWFYISESD